MITWCVNGMGGRVYSGIPSADVAIAMAIDLERYEYDQYDDETVLTRLDVEVETIESEYEGGRNWILVSGRNSRGLSAHPEERCDACRLTRAGQRVLSASGCP